MSKWSSLSSPFFILYQQLRTEATPKIIVIFRNRKPQPHAVLAIRPGGSCAITLRNRGIYAVAQLHITITGLLTSSRITAQDRPKVNNPSYNYLRNHSTCHYNSIDSQNNNCRSSKFDYHCNNNEDDLDLYNILCRSKCRSSSFD